MEALWVSQRAYLRHLLTLHPDWTCQQVADAVGCSTSMVSKWKRRFAQAAPDDVMVLFSRSRARHHPPPGLDPEVISRIVEIRQAPPDHLQRVPGPRAILYYVHRDPELLASGKRLPRSTCTIWRILHRCGLLPHVSMVRKPRLDTKSIWPPRWFFASLPLVPHTSQCRWTALCWITSSFTEPSR